MSLRDISLKKAYSSDVDDILADFYIPALQQATEYQRLAGSARFLRTVLDTASGPTYNRY